MRVRARVRVRRGQVYAHRMYARRVQDGRDTISFEDRDRDRAVLHYITGYGYPLIYRVFFLTRPQMSVVLPGEGWRSPARSEASRERKVSPSLLSFSLSLDTLPLLPLGMEYLPKYDGARTVYGLSQQAPLIHAARGEVGCCCL